MKICFWKTPSSLLVSLTAIIILMLFVTGMILRARSGDVDPRVSYDVKHTSPTLNLSAAHPQNIVSTMDGEVARTAERIGEATALALSASLLTATGQLQGHAATSAEELLINLRGQQLLPPGLLSTGKDGLLTSPYGTLALRYRPAPLAIEILSLGRVPADGPALLLRVPDETAEKGEARLYVANQLSGVRIPLAFAPAAEVIALGWSPEPLRSLK